MSLVSITASKRYDVGYRLNIAANLTQRFINGVNPITATQEAEIAVPLQNAAAAALAVAGYYALPAGTATVADNDVVPVKNSAGTSTVDATAVVASNGVLSGLNLAATVAMVDNGDALTVPVTGTYTTTATISVANGVVTGIVLS